MVKDRLVVFTLEFLVVHLLGGWHFACKDGGGHGVHDAVHPQNEGRGHRGVLVDERAETDKNNEVDCAGQLELNELAQVLEDVPSVLEAVNHHPQVAHEDVRGLFDDIAGVPHLGDPHIGLAERETVGYVVARNTDDLLVLLKNLSQQVLLANRDFRQNIDFKDHLFLFVLQILNLSF